MKTLLAMIAEFEVLQAKFENEGQALLKSEMAEFFKTNPGIKVIKWAQYSPYFNDGDECIFRVNSPVFCNAEDAENISSYGEYEGEDKDTVWLWGDDVYEDFTASPTEAEIAAMEVLNKAFSSSAAEPIFQALFGNHVEVTITPEGISVDSHDHD